MQGVRPPSTGGGPVSIRLEDYGLRAMTPDQQHKRDLILIACARLRRDGIVLLLPPIARRTR